MSTACLIAQQLRICRIFRNPATVKFAELFVYSDTGERYRLWPWSHVRSSGDLIVIRNDITVPALTLSFLLYLCLCPQIFLSEIFCYILLYVSFWLSRFLSILSLHSLLFNIHFFVQRTQSTVAYVFGCTTLTANNTLFNKSNGENKLNLWSEQRRFLSIV